MCESLRLRRDGITGMWTIIREKMKQLWFDKRQFGKVTPAPALSAVSGSREMCPLVCILHKETIKFVSDTIQANCVLIDYF